MRKGRITKAQRRALYTDWANFGIEPGHHLLDLDAIFGCTAARTLEIGFGNGEVLIAMAEAEPNTNFIGIDVYLPGIGALLNKIKSKALTNARIIRADAALVIPQCFADRSLNKILILFPDPWPKKRHHKRRLIQSDFVAMLADKLCPGSILQLATDSEDYAQAMCDAIIECGRYQKVARRPRPTTAYERRAQALQYRIYELYYKVLNKP